MKIKIKSEDFKFSFPVPNWLINEKLIVWSLKQGKKYNPDMKEIPIEIIEPFIKEFKKCIKDYKHFELVHVESSDGDIVIIEL